MSDAGQHKIYQIYYNATTERENDKGFLQLDNLSNQRPDWAEYWPIRNFLLGSELDGKSYYAFLSPKFRQKTGLGSAEVLEFLDSADEDVVLFSPFFDQSAFSINVFEQASSAHRGIYPTLVAAFRFLDPAADVPNLVMTSRNTVFCNYFAAKKHVWDRWFASGEKLFSICEANESPVARMLNSFVNYLGRRVQAKVFVIERMISYLLATNGSWTVRAYNPMGLPFGMTRVARFRRELSVLDALKIAYCDTGRMEYLQAYSEIRSEIVEKIRK